MNKILIIGIVFMLLSFFGIFANASIYNINLTTNTLYFNNNTRFNLYLSSNSLISGWIGSNSLNLTHIIQSFNSTSLILIPNNYYYKFNFSSGNFVGQSLSPTMLPILINTPKIQQYSPFAFVLFVVAMILSIFIILLLLGFFHYQTADLMGGIIGFSIAFIAGIMMIFALLYTTTAVTSIYTINTINTITQNIIIHSTSNVSQPIGSNLLLGLYGYILIFLDFIFGFIFLFLSFISFKKIRKENQYK